MLQEQSKEQKYIFSIVMAIYNVEEYLEEAIESVIDQSLDFERHVQLILVNDGSPDNSGEICLRYKNKYPNNVVYIHKQNGGVSSARNEGLKHVEGKYVNFLDADDMLTSNTLEEVYHFFENNYNYVDVVSIPLQFFEASNRPHILNYKYKKTRIIHILKEYNHIQMHIGSSFIKASEIESYCFNTEMKYAEDAELLNKIILNKCAYGVLNSSKYMYRKRANNSSAVQVGVNRVEWYTKYLRTFSKSTICYAKGKLGFVPKYIQYMVMYDLQWRFNVEEIPEGILTAQEQEEFLDTLVDVLGLIDDDIILEQKNLNYYRKLFVLKIKYSKRHHPINKLIFEENNATLFYNDISINVLKNQSVIIDFIEPLENRIIIEGHFGSAFDKDQLEIFGKMNDEVIRGQRIDRSIDNIYSLNHLVKEYYGFRYELDLNLDISQKQSFKFYALINDLEVLLKIDFGKFSRLTRKNYVSHDNYTLNANENEIIIERCGIKDKIKKELRYLKYLYKLKEEGSRKAAALRVFYHIFNTFMNKKNIWLFMDRQDKADDNAEHLFKYAVKQNDNIKKYFIIKKDSQDFNRLKQYGKVINFGSYRHKILHLFANKIISSHADDWTINPYFSMEKYYKDIICNDFIFLQHGIIKHDLSSWLNKYRRNIGLFVTSTVPEYNSILEGKYNYGEINVKLTGLPRYDNLIDQNKKQILIAPTWRKSIVHPRNQQTGIRPYNEGFKKTDYYNMYNKLLNDSDLINFAKTKGYEIVFFPHPDIQQQLIDFERNDYVKFVDYNTSYQKLFNESSLLITDYSSVAFDFAYMSKPVLYFQFDNNHYKEGYFDYETMGFGEVCSDYEQLTQKLKRYIGDNCLMEEKYLNRVKNFYTYNDRNNCQRVYNEILDFNK